MSVELDFDEAPAPPETAAVANAADEEIGDEEAVAWQSAAHALPFNVAHTMGDRLGADLSDVRVHTGALAAAHSARAVTEENDITFAPGEYAPGTREGDHLLAHELAHVVQQRGGNAHGPQAKRRDGGGVGALEADADTAADAVDAGADAALGPAPRGALRKPLPETGAAPPQEKRKLFTIRAQLIRAQHELDLLAGPRRGDAVVAALEQAAQDLHGLGYLWMFTQEAREALKPVARGVATEISRMFQLAPVAATAVGFCVQALEHAFGEKIAPHQNTGWGRPAVGSLEPEERKAAILDALGETGTLLDRALAADGDREPAVPAAALGKLAAVEHLLGEASDLDRAARAELQPAVNAVSAQAEDLRFKCSEPIPSSVRELLIRLSQVRQKVGIGDWQMALQGETLADLRRGYDPKVGDEFDRLVGKLAESIAASYDICAEAVTQVQTMKDAKDPPVVKSHGWRDLAVFAVKLAAGPVVERLIEAVAPGEADFSKTKVLADPYAKTFPGQEEHAEGGLLGALIKKGLEKAVDKYVIEPITESGEAEAEAPGVDVALFFAQQRTELRIQQARVKSALVDDLAGYKSALAESPQGVLGELQGAVASYGVLGSGKTDAGIAADIQEPQREATTIAYVRLLATEGVTSTLEAKDTAQKLHAEVWGDSYTAPEWEGEGVDLERMLGITGGTMDLNANGLINLQFTTPEDPSQKVELTKAWVNGIGPKLRPILEKRKLRDLGIPIRARGGPFVRLGSPAFAMVGKSDSGDFSARGAPDEYGQAEAWLFRKGGGAPGEDREAAMERAAQEIIDEELCNKSIADHDRQLEAH